MGVVAGAVFEGVGERAARVRCLPNVDHGEVVAEGWEPRAARCFAFNADGPGEAAIGAENSLFSFSQRSVTRIGNGRHS